MNTSMVRHHKIDLEVVVRDHDPPYDYTLDVEFDFFPLSYEHDDLVTVTRCTRRVRSAPDGYDYEDVDINSLEYDDQERLYNDAVAEGVVELAKELNKLKGTP
jgi:hypothetical protein